jgi:DNA-binding CsgD family transcriptional regulator
MPDEEVARRIGHSVAAIAYRRSTRGIPKFNARRMPSLTAEQKALLGKMPDEEVARRLGRSVSSIVAYRGNLRIPIFVPAGGRPARAKRRPWTASDIALLGKLPDDEVARLTGRRVGAITTQRWKLGIANCNSKKRDWTAKEDSLLGKLSDKEIASRLNRSPESVRRRRRTLGRLDPSVRPGWSRREDDLLGTAPDKAIALRIGRSLLAVRARRQARRIKPWRDASGIKRSGGRR